MGERVRAPPLARRIGHRHDAEAQLHRVLQRSHRGRPHPWHHLLFRSFRPLEDALARYDRGEFVYSATGGGGVREASFYGEAAVSEGYVDRHWPKSLEKIAFDQETLAQALIVARRV